MIASELNETLKSCKEAVEILCNLEEKLKQEDLIGRPKHAGGKFPLTILSLNLVVKKLYPFHVGCVFVSWYACLVYTLNISRFILKEVTEIQTHSHLQHN